MIYLLTNVAKTPDVPLDGTIFSGNTGQKDRAPFMDKNIPIISKQARLNAPVSAFLSFIKSWHDVKVSK